MFFLETENGKYPFNVGDTIKINAVAGIPIRWRLHVEGDDRHVGDSFAIELHHDLFEKFLFTVNKVDGDNPLIFDLFTKTEGFSVGAHRFPIVQVLRTICVIEVNAVVRMTIDIPLPVGDDPPPTSRRKKEPAVEGEENDEPKAKKLGPWTSFGVRSLYGVMLLILLCSLTCGGFTFWTGGKVVNLFTDWARMSLSSVELQEEVQPPAATPQEDPANPIPTLLESRPVTQPR